jgi:GDP-4-dehydro-6-deoxy-D-mannose reductase
MYWKILIDGIPGEIYNVCSGVGIKIRDILIQLIDESNKKINIIEDERVHSIKDVKQIIGCNKKIMQLIGG